MSELLDSFKAQFPERCQTCPVMLGFCATAESFERNAENTLEPLSEAIESGPFDVSALNEVWFELHTEMLDMTTSYELEMTHRVSDLADQSIMCPGAKRGAPEYFPFSWKVIAFLRNSRICRNPGLSTILAKNS